MKEKLQKIKSFFILLPNILSVFFSKPETERYPFEKSELPERYRGRVSIRPENCVGCRMCVVDCPADALRLEKDSKTQFRLYHFHDKCTYCGQCEQSCRFDAIYMENAYVQPTSDRADFSVILVDRRDPPEE